MEKKCMSIPTSNFFESLGKPIKDEYGRSIGTIASFAVRPNGQINEIFVDHGDGEIARYATEQIRINENGATLFSSTKLKVESMCNEIPLIWRKDQALKGLLEKKKVPLELSEELHNAFESAYTQLKAEAQAMMENIDKQITICSKQIGDLNNAFVNLEIEHEIGQVNDSAYENAMVLIQENMRCIKTERDDMELMKSKLSNLLLGENTHQLVIPPPVPVEQEALQETDSASSSLPEPPVIVYVKNVNTRD
jgi:hypothetical protein